MVDLTPILLLGNTKICLIIGRRIMLHDPSHMTPVPSADEIKLTDYEKDILKGLASQKAEIAGLSIHKEKAKLWTQLNDLESVRPMVWINEIPWHEMNVNEELTLKCSHPWARQLEDTLRKELYQWRHLPADMIVSPYIECPLQIHSTDFGIKEQVDIATTDSDNDIYSRHFKIQINEPEDIDKIIMPKITHNVKATEISYNMMLELFEGIIPVKKSRSKPYLVYTLGFSYSLVGCSRSNDGPRYETADGS